MAASFYFYDYETFGLSVSQDRPSQFAGQRTDAELNPIGPPLMRYCQPSEDYLPKPMACLLTGISPQHCLSQGLSELEFFKAILHEFSQPESCVLGYNSLRFDDEVTRFGLYRNLFDPYAREWQQGNSRWDLVDLVRACHALRPEGLQWPSLDGQVSFKLELLTQANGLDHAQAHDALSDVLATIALARCIKQAQPRLFDYYFRLRRKDEVRQLLYPLLQQPLLHVSGRYPNSRGNLALVLPLCEHPTAPGQVLVYDLATDPQCFEGYSADDLQQALFSFSAELGDKPRLPIKAVHLNLSPFLAPLKVLTPELAERWQLDIERQQQHARLLKVGLPWLSLLPQLYRSQSFEAISDPELQLYTGGFLSATDRRLLDSVRQLSAAELLQARPAFKDPRLAELVFRFKARNHVDCLTEEEAVRWQRHCQQRLKQQWPEFQAELQQAQSLQADAPVLTELTQYQQQLFSKFDIDL